MNMELSQGEDGAMHRSAGGPDRRHHSPARRIRWRVRPVAAVAAVAILAMPGLPVMVASAGNAASAAARSVTLARLGVKPVPLPGVKTLAGTVRLITGQLMRLTPTDGGHYTATQDPASIMPNAGGRPQAQLVIQAKTAPGSTSSTITATPTYAQRLVDSGAVDPHLFNVTWLAAHGDTTSLPVVVHYAPTMTTPAVAKAVAALPDASYVPGSATGSQATVKVGLDRHPGAFWSAVTETPPADPKTRSGRVWFENPNAPRVLRDGITALTLAGAPRGAPQPAPRGTLPGLTTPTYQLTVQVHGFTDPSRWCRASTVICYATSNLIGRDGPGLGQEFLPANVACNQTTTCDTLIITFDVPAGSYQLGIWADATLVASGEASYFNAPLYYIRPQIGLDANRSLDVHADGAMTPTLSTPKPSELMNTENGELFSGPNPVTALVSSQLANGQTHEGVVDSEAVPFWGYTIPEKQSVTTGTFSFHTDQIAEQPPVAMSVADTGHAGISLSPAYPIWRQMLPSVVAESFGFDPPVTDFPNGTHEYPVVDVGDGSVAGFADRDLTGKLALMRPGVRNLGVVPTGPTSPEQECTIEPDALQRALSAHAAGVLFDLSLTGSYWQGGCIGVVPDPPGQYATWPAIPWVTIPAAQAQKVRTLLQTRPLSIQATASDRPSYLYFISHNNERVMPTSLAQTVTAKDLVTEHATFHALSPGDTQSPDLLMESVNPELPQDLAGDFVDLRSQTPYPLTLYESTSPDSMLEETVDEANPQTGSAGDNPYTRFSTPQAPGAATVNYGQTPFTVGALTLPAQARGLLDFTNVTGADRPTETGQVLPPGLCAMCRQGNDLVPTVDVVSGAEADGSTTGGNVFATHVLAGQLTSNGAAVPHDPGGLGWTLSPGAANYELTVQASDAHYVWTFTSAPPATDSTSTWPPGKECINGLFDPSVLEDPCAPVPLVFVRYAAPVDGANRAAAGNLQTLTITAYHDGDRAPGITGLTQQVSFDHGATWATVRVSPTHTPGTYTASFTTPPLSQTDGFVSLRTTAKDVGGNTTDQTYLDSYALK